MPNDPTCLPTDNLEEEVTPAKDQYVDMVKPKHTEVPVKPGIETIPIKKLSYNNGVPRIVWTEKEVERMNTIENLQCCDWQVFLWMA